MNAPSFGKYIRKRREEIALPLREVAAYLAIDTSTLSKVERGERFASVDYLKPLSEILELSIKEVQTAYIAEKISKEFAGLEYLSAGLKEAEKLIRIKGNNVI